MPVLLTQNVSGDWGHNFNGCINIHYAAPPYSVRISSTYLLPFGKLWLGPVCWPLCATPGNEACRKTQNLRRVGKNSSPILAVCGQKFMKFWDNVGDPRGFQCLCLIVYGMFHYRWPQLFYGRLFAQFTVHCLPKFVGVLFVISVCEAWQWSRVQNLRVVGKNYDPILSHLWTKVHDILRRRRHSF